MASAEKKIDKSSFEQIECIGEGSYAKVMQSKLIQEGHKDFGKEFAIKILDKSQILRLDKMRYVYLEKEVFKTCGNHTHIVSMYYSFQDSTSLYFVLDLCTGGNLFEKIQTHGKLPEDLTKHWFAETCLAIEHMHEKGYVHRDIKPENILIHEDRHVRVTDFGTIRKLEQDDETTMSPAQSPTFAEMTTTFQAQAQRKKSFVGTAQYVSPELLENRQKDVRAMDFWALGVLLYQTLVGKPPFRGATDYLTFEAILAGNYDPPKDLNPDASDLISKLLQVEENDRLGMNGWDEFKKHSFFSSIDWDKLHEIDPPAEPVIIELASLDTTTFVKRNTGKKYRTSKTFSQRCCCCCANSEKYVPDTKACNNFLIGDEIILLESLISLPSFWGSSERVLLLTNKGRFVFIDFEYQYVSNEFEWTTSVYASVQNDKEFILRADGKELNITLKTGSSSDWASKLNELQNSHS